MTGWYFCSYVENRQFRVRTPSLILPKNRSFLWTAHWTHKQSNVWHNDSIKIQKSQHNIKIRKGHHVIQAYAVYVHCSCWSNNPILSLWNYSEHLKTHRVGLSRTYTTRTQSLVIGSTKSSWVSLSGRWCLAGAGPSLTKSSNVFSLAQDHRKSVRDTLHASKHQRGGTVRFDI